METSYGQWLVGVDFNPSGNPDVAEIKKAAADLIDKLQWIAEDHNHPGARCASLAITHFEDAAMWGVKAVTKRPRT